MNTVSSYTLVLRTNFDNCPIYNGGAILKLNSAKSEKSVVRAQLSPISFKEDSGDYFLVFLTEERNLIKLPLANPPKKCELSCEKLDLEKHFACGIICERQAEFYVCCFTSKNQSTIKINEFKKYYAQDFKIKTAGKFEAETNEHEKAVTAKNEDKQSALALTYDDEAVAEINYYELEKELSKGSNNDEYKFITDTDFIGEDKTEEKIAEGENDATKSENCACISENEEPKFFASIKEKLQELFNKYPPIDSLTQLIPQSEWIKIPYGNNAFYVIGIIKENDIPAYIAYGVPGACKSKPKGFERYSKFIPESLFYCDSGYWCIFQSAKTGEEITDE